MSDGTGYHPLSHSSSSDVFAKESIQVFPAKRSSQAGTASPWQFFLRTAAFIVMECAFIALAARASIKPFALSLSPSRLTEAKATATLLSIVWHAIAVLLVKDIIVHIFSAEWMEQVRKSGRVVLEESDIVSRVSSSYIDHMQHLVSPIATLPFRLGFISIILLLALKGLGPSTITVGLISFPSPTRIQIANLNLTQLPVTVVENGQSTHGFSISAMDRANLVVRLEVLEKSFYGFGSQQPNVLIPWPATGLMSSNQMYRYETDVVTFNYSCSWQKPAPRNNSEDQWEWEIANRTYLLHYGPTSQLGNGRAPLCGSSIFPLIGNDEDEDTNDIASNPLTGFIFGGTSSKIQAPSSSDALSRRSWDLNDLPALFPPNVTLDDYGVTALICDPQFQIRPATATLSHGSLSLSALHAGPPVVQNILENAANLLFSTSLGVAASFSNAFNLGTGCVAANDISRMLFLPNQSDYQAPLPIERINRNMNQMLLSSSKAFLSGFNGTSTGAEFRLPTFEMVDADAVVEAESLGLGGSKPYLIALTVLVGVLTVLFISIVIIIRRSELCTFDLKHIVETLEVYPHQ